MPSSSRLASRAPRRPRCDALIPSQALSSLVTAGALLWLSCMPRFSAYEEAERAMKRQEWIRAESLYRQVLKQEKEHARARVRLAQLLAREAQQIWDDDEGSGPSRGRIKEALELDHDCLPAHLLEIELDLSEDLISLQEAAVRLRSQVRRHPRSPEPRLALGRVLLEIGQISEAMENFHLGGQLAPNEVEHRVLLLEALHRINPEDGVARMRNLLALNPDSLTILLSFVRILAKDGDFHAALEALKRAAAVAPRDMRVSFARRRLERLRREWNVELQR